MSWSDPIADMLTRIRNAHRAELDVVDVPHSRLKAEITRILKREGYIVDYTVEGAVRKTIRVYMKYVEGHKPAIRGIRRESKAGRRVYVPASKVPRVLSGMGIAILSTSTGIMTDNEARQQHIGGEVLCAVW
jgi:small subunit ribosomal protein S8